MNNNEGYFVEVSYDSNKGKRHYYTLDDSLKINDEVVVETPLGIELGIVSGNLIKESDSLYNENTLTIIRKATKDDLNSYENNKLESIKAIKIFNDGVAKLNLDMKLVNAIFTLDKGKILFSYVSEERVDFRELLKELSSILKCRIELKQIGARDRSKNIGGLGICGLPLCCCSFLNEFETITASTTTIAMIAIRLATFANELDFLFSSILLIPPVRQYPDGRLHSLLAKAHEEHLPVLEIFLLVLLHLLTV